MYELIFYMLWLLNVIVYFGFRRAVKDTNSDLYRELFGEGAGKSKRKLLGYNKFIWSEPEGLHQRVLFWVNTQKAAAFVFYIYIFILVSKFLISKL